MDPLFQEAGSNAAGATRYCFRFRPNGTSNPVAAECIGTFITSITYTATGIYLVTFASNHASLLTFNGSVQSNSGGPAQGFTLEIDTAATNLSATGGSVLAIAGVNPSGTRATIAHDANTFILCEVVFSENTVLCP